MNKIYNFKSDGITPEMSVHIIEYDWNIKLLLIWKLIMNAGVTLNKETTEQNIDEFEIYLDDKYKLNQTGEFMIPHYHSICMISQLIIGFIFSKYKKIV